MNPLWSLILIGVMIIIILVAIIIIIRKLIKRKKKKYEIPSDIIEDLKRVEEIFKEAEGTITPQEAMLKLYKEKMKGGSNGKTKIIQESTGKETTTSSNSTGTTTTTTTTGTTTDNIANNSNQLAGIKRREQEVTSRELSKQLGGQKDIQVLSAPEAGQDKRDFGEVGGSNRKHKRIFPRRKQ